MALQYSEKVTPRRLLRLDRQQLWQLVQDPRNESLERLRHFDAHQGRRLMLLRVLDQDTGRGGLYQKCGLLVVYEA